MTKLTCDKRNPVTRLSNRAWICDEIVSIWCVHDSQWQVEYRYCTKNHSVKSNQIKSNLLPQTTANTMTVEGRRFDRVISPNRPLGRAIGDAVVDISLTIVHWCWSCLQEYLIFYWSIWFFPDSRYHFTRGFCYNFSPSRQSIKKSHYIVS